MPAEPDFSRDALARFIDYVMDKNLVNPSTAQGWRVATTKVLTELTAEERADVRRIDVDSTFPHHHRGADTLREVALVHVDVQVTHQDSVSLREILPNQWRDDNPAA